MGLEPGQGPQIFLQYMSLYIVPNVLGDLSLSSRAQSKHSGLYIPGQNTEATDL